MTLKPPPWKSGDLIINTRTGEHGRYRGNGGWVLGENDREIIHVVPLEPDPDKAPHGLLYWDRSECQLTKRDHLEVVKGGKR